MHDFDYGTGFESVASELEEQFDAEADFGYAGGCVNMVLDLRSGHRVNVTDYQTCFLTNLYKRSAFDGFSVGVYTRDGFDNGDEPLVMVSAQVDVAGLPDLITQAINQTPTKR